VVALTGPLEDLPAERAGEHAAWEAASAPLADLAVARPVLSHWAGRVRATGLLRRLAPSAEEASTLATRAALVVAALPGPGRELRGHLANRLLHDAHALDDGGELSALVLGAAAVLGGHDPGESADGRGPARGPARGAAWRRQVWSSVGVAVGDLSAPVLTLGLPGDPGSATGRALGVWRESGQPVHLTLRQLSVDPPTLPLAGRDVFVCENPSVVERAADELGAACVPLVCTHGHASSAVAALLDLLVGAGGRLHHHGDLDWGGLRIAGRVIGTWDAAPWRLGARDYDDAVARGLGGRPLGPVAAESPWDPRLCARMAEVGLAVEEEAVADVLLADLA
jgi:uncharacterized protein (TIGR02679 family)